MRIVSDADHRMSSSSSQASCPTRRRAAPYGKIPGATFRPSVLSTQK